MIRYSMYMGVNSTLISGGILMLEDPYKNKIQIDVRSLLKLPYGGMKKNELTDMLRNKAFNVMGYQASFDYSKILVFTRNGDIRILYKDEVTGDYELSKESIRDERLQSRFVVVGVICSKTDKTAEYILWCKDRKIVRTTTRLFKQFEGMDLSQHASNKFNLAKTLEKAMKNPGEVCLL